MDTYNMIEDVAGHRQRAADTLRHAQHKRGAGRHRARIWRSDVMLLENHGALAVGGDVVTAFYRMESLELWAKITINAVILGRRAMTSAGKTSIS